MFICFDGLNTAFRWANVSASLTRLCPHAQSASARFTPASNDFSSLWLNTVIPLAIMADFKYISRA